MHSRFREYPTGRSGAGLLLLRVTVAGYPLIVAHQVFGVGWLLLALSLLTLLGYLFAWGVSALLFSSLLLGPIGTDPITSFFVAMNCLALLLLGPGAISVDAHRFGRRNIAIKRVERH